MNIWEVNGQNKQKRVEKEDEENKKKRNVGESSNYRAIVRGFLSQVFPSRGTSFQLNDQGVMSFTYEHLTFVVDIPVSVGSFFVYTVLFDPKSVNGRNGDNRRPIADINTRALRLNYLQEDTRGACVGIDKGTEEIMLSYTGRIKDINHVDFKNILENFIDTALNIDKELKETTTTTGNSDDDSYSNGDDDGEL